MLSFPLLIIVCLLSQAASQFYDTGPACVRPSLSRCPDNPALGGTLSVDFTNETTTGFSVWLAPSPQYKDDGMYLTLSRSGDTPIISSRNYIMFGNVKVVMKKVSAAGIVSGIALQSDCMDEINFTFFSYMSTVETTWYGRYSVQDQVNSNRILGVEDGTNSDGFNTYEVDWTNSKIMWIINGVLVRTLTRAEVSSTTQYPQTPMALRIGAYDVGDDGYGIQWAGGTVYWAGGPYSMIVKSVEMTDYSTGSFYSYLNNSCGLESVRSDNTTKGININASPVSISAVATASSTAPTTSASATASAGLSIATEAAIIVCASIAGIAVIVLAVLIWQRIATQRVSEQEDNEKHTRSPSIADSNSRVLYSIEEVEECVTEPGPLGIPGLRPRTPNTTGSA